MLQCVPLGCGTLGIDAGGLAEVDAELPVAIVEAYRAASVARGTAIARMQLHTKRVAAIFKVSKNRKKAERAVAYFVVCSFATLLLSPTIVQVSVSLSRRPCCCDLCCTTTMDMFDPALLTAEAGPSNYASLPTDDINPDTSDARRPAFTYASKAIVDESWTQLEAFPGEEDDNASDYETEEEVQAASIPALQPADIEDIRFCIAGLLCHARLWDGYTDGRPQTSRRVSAYCTCSRHCVVFCSLIQGTMQNLNTAEPFARIGTHILRGRHEKLLGSELLFQHEAGD